LDYQSVLQYLYDLTDYEKERIARYDPDTLDLSRVRRVLARMRNPHQRFPSIHIAGTKGKGSVAAMCASVLQTAGLRTGLYTSPHLHTFRERIRMNGEPIPEGALTALFRECRPIFDTEPELTTFEAITTLAFAFFAQQQVDFAVVEVGLGGRLDATNVIMPQLSIITSLSFDHTYLLGNTLADIAREKAGIIKPGVPTVCAPQEPEALAIIQQICAERNSPLTLIGRDWTWQLLTIPPSQSSSGTPTFGGASDLPPDLDGQSFHLQHLQKGSPLEGTYTISLLGRHQVNNAAVAIAALDLLKRGGTPLHRRHIRQGLANVRWPGRFEVLQQDPPLIVDCAHNGDSIAKLVAALKEWFPGRRWTFILGASNDKDVPGMLRELAPLADRLLATQSRHPRAMASVEVADLASDILPKAGAPFTEISATSDVGTAVSLALSGGHGWRSSLHSPPPEERGRAICVTGSIFVVADAREVWAAYTSRPLPEADHPKTRESLLPAFSPATQTQTVTG
jgi:dihydrofolate synthase/folylpolyglutamate synthase